MIVLFALSKKDKETLTKEIDKEPKQTIQLYDVNELKDFLNKNKVEYVFVNQKFFPLSSNGDLLTELKIKHPYIHFIIVGKMNIDLIVNYIKKGADYYIKSPIQPSEFRKVFKKLSNPEKGIVSYLKKEATLFQIIKQVSFTMEIDPLLNMVIDSSMELTSASLGSLILYTPDDDILYVHSVRGVSKDSKEDGFFGFDDKYLKKIIKEGKYIFLSEKEYSLRPEKKQEYKSLILSPIASNVGGYGLVINAKRIDDENDFYPDEIRAVSSLASEIAPAVRNALLHSKTRELIIKDDLTDAYNRRFFENYLEEEIQKAKKFQNNLSIIFLDVDNLKEVNEKYGHLMGSKVLQEIAHRIILAVRGIDKVVRYGGDEFCIILPETDANGAYLVAERIKNTIAAKPFLVSESLETYLTASFGIASFPKHATSKEELIKKADKAMFDVKVFKKNGIKLAGP
jgi:diguanylate cyclase (GGDEF)-like protein